MKKHKKNKVSEKTIEPASLNVKKSNSSLGQSLGGSSATFRIDLGYTSGVEFSFDDLEKNDE
jgi:hypothetical protein